MKRILATTTFALLLAGCASKPHPIVGRWVLHGDNAKNGDAITFFADGTFASEEHSTEDLNGTYSLSSDQIKISVEKRGGEEVINKTFVMDYQINGAKLILRFDGDTTRTLWKE